MSSAWEDVDERAFKFSRHDGDDRERRAEFMRRGGGEAVELRQVLLAFQHEFGRRKRVGELAAFLGDLPRVDRNIADRRA